MSLAKELDAGPTPYSMHELAVSVALRIFKGAGAALREGRFTAQLTAGLAALQWAKEGRVVPALLGAFEQTLYKLYKPGVNDQPQREVRAAWRRVRQGAKSYDCQDACDRARLVPGSWFESVCDGCIPESSGISNRCEPAIFEFFLLSFLGTNILRRLDWRLSGGSLYFVQPFFAVFFCIPVPGAIRT